MNSKERVRTTFQHREPDRVPVTELYINSPAASDILGRQALTGWGGKVRCKIQNEMLMQGRGEEFYHQEVVDLVDVYRAMALDTVIIERPPLRHPQIPVRIAENVWRFEDKAGGTFREVEYCPETDLFHETGSSLASGGTEAFERYVDMLDRDDIDLDRWSWHQAEYIIEKCGADMFVMAVVEVDFPPMSFGSLGGLFLEAMAFRPDLVERYLDYRVRKGLKFVEKYAAMGVDAVFDGEDLAGNNGPLFSPADYKRFYMPRFQKIIQACHDHNMLYVRHTDGNIMAFADEFLVQTGIDAYHSIDPGAGMDIGLLKKRYGDKVTLWGNLDCAMLQTATPDEIRREVERIIRIASPGGGHVFTSSNTIDSKVPTRNFVAMVEAVKEFGKYPLA